MTGKYRISVCLAVYNGALQEWLRFCSSWALGGKNWIVVVEDASQDAYVAILEGFNYKRIRIISVHGKQTGKSTAQAG